MKLAVASCAKLQQTNPQPVWAEIMAERPDVLLLLGDNIYLDKDNHSVPAALAAYNASITTGSAIELHFSMIRPCSPYDASCSIRSSN